MSQKPMYAPRVSRSPWAKLTMPVALWRSTIPKAISAAIAPCAIPAASRATNRAIGLGLDFDAGKAAEVLDELLGGGATRGVDQLGEVGHVVLTVVLVLTTHARVVHLVQLGDDGLRVDRLGLLGGG